MSLRSVRMAGGGAAAHLQRLEVEPDAAPFLAAAKAAGMPAVYVVRNADLAALRSVENLVVDRGRKHKAKGLSRLLLGHRQIPLISGSYTAAGQLIRSARTLLSHALKRNERNVFIIGADEGPFDALWQRANAASSRSSEPSRSTEADGPGVAPSLADPRRLLLQLLPELPVPESVQRKYIGSSAEVQLVWQLIVRVAKQNEPVLILGDTGTGKEVVARLIHEQSPRRLRTFTPVNCGAIPRELLESELFGYEPGSHSTARERKLGLWQVASGGTLFLDEVGDLAPEHQAKILRALQEGAIRPVGAQREVRVDSRVVAATNRDLFAMVQAREFREDLYYRLRPLLIRTSPLREHPEDIALLAGAFWKQITRDTESRLPASMVAALERYRWPGNARELRGVLSSLLAFFGRDGLAPAHLQAVFEFEGQASTGGKPPATGVELGMHRIECLHHLRRVDEVVRAAKVALRAVATHARTDPKTLEGLRAALPHRLDELEQLCLRPLLFHSEVTFSAVLRLKGSLLTFHSILAGDPTVVRDYWDDPLAGEFRAVLSTVFQEVERLLKES